MKIDPINQSLPISPIDLPAKQPEKQLQQFEQKEEARKDDISVEQAVDLINKTMQNYNTELQFTMHKGSGEYIVKVIDTNTHEVIREIPPERVLDMVAYFKQVLGLLVDRFI